MNSSNTQILSGNPIGNRSTKNVNAKKTQLISSAYQRQRNIVRSLRMKIAAQERKMTKLTNLVGDELITRSRKDPRVK